MDHGGDARQIQRESVGTPNIERSDGRYRDSSTGDVTDVPTHGFNISTERA